MISGQRNAPHNRTHALSQETAADKAPTLTTKGFVDMTLASACKSRTKTLLQSIVEWRFTPTISFHSFFCSACDIAQPLCIARLHLSALNQAIQ